MRTYLLIWLRTVSLGLGALMAAVFVPLPASGSASRRLAARPDPLFSVPPAGAFLLPSADAEAHIMAALERQLSTLSDDIAGLRLSLEAMSPLPDQDEFYIPIDPANLDGEPVFDSGVSPLVDLYLSERDRADTAKLMAEWSPVSIAA
jgi:hypothetical protein